MALIIIALICGFVKRKTAKSVNTLNYRWYYLELALNNGAATIVQCQYVDKRAKGLKIPPQGIVTVKFTFSLEKLIEVVNSEFEGGFTDAIITHQHTLTLDGPICGSI